MNRTDIVTTPNIEGAQITGYLGIVYARENSDDAVFNEIISQSEALGADKVVGFQLQWQSPQRFYASGTAVTITQL
ncbi:MAG: hypothetical protein KC413_22355 [Anaerolineales bacterium]|nr:hypothetical protein [Anaerolineales bacterium]